MKTQFYIDRQFGHPIHLNVENAIFTGCTHKGKMEDKITEKYKGKFISEVKELFETAFKGTYACIHSSDYTSLLRQHDAWSTRMRQKWNRISSIGCPKDLQKSLKDSIDIDRKKQYRVELQLRDKYIELKNTHGFVFYENKFGDLGGKLEDLDD